MFTTNQICTPRQILENTQENQIYTFYLFVHVKADFDSPNCVMVYSGISAELISVYRIPLFNTLILNHSTPSEAH